MFLKILKLDELLCVIIMQLELRISRTNNSFILTFSTVANQINYAKKHFSPSTNFYSFIFFYFHPLFSVMYAMIMKICILMF